MLVFRILCHFFILCKREMTKPIFDMEAVLQALRDGKSLNGKDGILIPLIKQLTEAAMQGELEQHLAE